MQAKLASFAPFFKTSVFSGLNFVLLSSNEWSLSWRCRWPVESSPEQLTFLCEPCTCGAVVFSPAMCKKNKNFSLIRDVMKCSVTILTREDRVEKEAISVMGGGDMRHNLSFTVTTVLTTLVYDSCHSAHGSPITCFPFDLIGIWPLITSINVSRQTQVLHVAQRNYFQHLGALSAFLSCPGVWSAAQLEGQSDQAARSTGESCCCCYPGAKGHTGQSATGLYMHAYTYLININ